MLKRFFIFIQFSISFIFMIFISAEAGSFILKIDDISGLDSPWPVLAGISFPEGAVKDPLHVRVLQDAREIPAQIDVTATWRDGSIRWALAAFTSSPAGEYLVEYGEKIARSPHPRPMQVREIADGGFLVDTGVALYQFQHDKLLPEDAWLLSRGQRIPILQGSGSGTYLVDNKGRTARVSSRFSDIETEILKEGPARFTLKRSGWYVTENEEKLARAKIWIYFSQGSPHVKITHSLIFTEDTNDVWVRDYGLEFKTPGLPENVYCALGYPSEEEIQGFPSEGQEVFMLQDTYPHFAERDYRALIGTYSGKEENILKDFGVAGDWAHGDYGNYGITIVMPWLSERFPKEISFGERGARAVLWSGRSGRELDFRAKTLIEEYWQTWTNRLSNIQEWMEMESNAQGTARTHDIWFMPHAGKYDENTVRKTAVAGARTPLALAQPEWICSSEAMGWPMQHKDTERFPEEEQIISDHWQRLIIPLRAFPLTGFISWGCYPSNSYVGTAINFGDARLTGLSEYAVRRVPFRMYARSGERTYYEYGRRFTRFTGDYAVAHWDAPGKTKGAFIRGMGREGPPFFWAGNTHNYNINNGEIRHWLHDYYLTGDERSLETVKMIKRNFEKQGYPQRGNIDTVKVLLTLSLLDWDEQILNTCRDIIHSVIDMESQNAIGGRNPLMKDLKQTLDFLDFYLETGDEFVKEAFLKLLDQRYRFNRRYGPIGHRNYDAHTHAIAYMLTGEEWFRRVAEQTIGDALYYSREHPLREQLDHMPENPLEWRSYGNIRLGQHAYHTSFIGFPTALKLIAEEGWSGMRTPVILKTRSIASGKILFPHESGKETRLSVTFNTVRDNLKPEIIRYPIGDSRKTVTGIRIEMEKRTQWPESLLTRPDDIYHAYITLPSSTETGLYLMSLGGEESFALLDITGDKAALYCPEGFWSPSGSPIRRRGEGAFGRAGMGMPMFFRVPSELEELKIFLSYNAEIKRPDGSVAVELSEENTGNLSVPVEGKGGIWSIKPHIRTFAGSCPQAFYRLLNVEPIVAFGTPDFLPEMEAVSVPEIKPALAPPSANVEFVPGITGKALRLSGKAELSFPAGERISQGGFTYFPGQKGTVEFWFKAARSTQEIPALYNGIKDFVFIHGPQVEMRHRYWLSHLDLYSMLQLELKSGASAPGGFQAKHFFREAEWNHIAYTWEIKEEETASTRLSIFLNGEKLDTDTGHGVGGITILPENRRINLKYENEDIVIGPFDGIIDSLRLSDNIRYSEDFTPSKEPFSTDSATRALFLFDGDLKGSSAFSSEFVEASEKR